MTSIEEHTSSEAQPPATAPSAIAAAAAPAPAGPSSGRRALPWLAGAAALLLVGGLTAVVATRGGDDAEAAGRGAPSSTVSAAASAASTAASTAAATAASTAGTVSNAAAATPTSAAATTVAPTTAVAPPATVPGSAAATTPATAPGTPPPPYQGPVETIALNAGAVNNATVATAAVGTVSVYSQPLMSPAPAFAEWTFGSSTQFGSPTVFLVTGTAGEWLRVQLPMKPNMVEGWVHNSEVSLAPNRHRIVVDLANRSVTLYDGSSAVAESVAVIGKPGTPTPTGTYYVTDLLRLDDPSTAYGPYVLATSARSDAFDFFNGGEPIVALHGTNQPSLLGSAASNGCVRLPNEVATQLASLTPLGTPVFIV